MVAAVEVMTSPSLDLGETVEIARVLESAGVGRLWLADAARTHKRDVYISLALCADATTRIRLGPGVTNPHTRDASVTACALATLVGLYGDRFALGMGRGDAAVVTSGGSRASFEQLETYLAALDDWHAEFGIDIPIALAASGPLSLRKAGQFGRGALISLGAHTALLRTGHEAYAAGRDGSKAEGASRELVFVIGLAIATESEHARYLARPLAAKKGKDLVRHDALYPAELEPLREQCAALNQAYDYAFHFDPEAPHARQVTEDLLRAFCVAGNPDECVEQIAPILSFVSTIEGATVAFQVGRRERLSTLQLLASGVLPRLGLHV